MKRLALVVLTLGVPGFWIHGCARNEPPTAVLKPPGAQVTMIHVAGMT